MIKTYEFDFLPDEVIPLAQALNEVCHALIIKDFNKTIGADEVTVENLRKNIHGLVKGININDHETITRLEVTQSEIEIILNSIKEVYRQVDDWEFGMRLGIEIVEMQAIERKLTAALNPDVLST